MAEIVLKCPKCGTEYSLPASAIPPAGREVECTACNNSWLALVGEAVDPRLESAVETDAEQNESPVSGVVRHEPSHSRASAEVESPLTPGDMPPLSRRLPENVLNILREEVEFEHRARMLDKAAVQPSAPDDDAYEIDVMWPATTITDAVDVPAHRIVEKNTVETVEKPTAEAAHQASSLTLPTELVTAYVPDDEIKPVPQPRSGYFTGFSFAVIVAVIALVMYRLPPDMAGTGAFADGLLEYRQQVDAGRDWLQQRVSNLLNAE